LKNYSNIKFSENQKGWGGLDISKNSTDVKNSNPKKWKANFRCALNSLADVKEITLSKSNKESKCVKIYQFVEDPTSKLKIIGKIKKIFRNMQKYIIHA
jgi:hypothetical protein